MKIARLSLEQGPRFAVLDEATEGYHVLAGDPMYSGYERTGQIVAGADARLVAPMIPRSKVVGLGANFTSDDDERAALRSKGMSLFLKPNTSVVGPESAIIVPSWAKDVQYEAELAIVIGKICKDVPVERASEVIFGYTVANDVTDAAALREDGDAVRGKSFDTSTPLGPVIETDLDTAALAIRSRLNGEPKQNGTTADMVRNCAELVSEVSAIFTLLPGDVIITGTPLGGGPLAAGDVVEVEVEGIGTLVNRVELA